MEKIKYSKDSGHSHVQVHFSWVVKEGVFEEVTVGVKFPEAGDVEEHAPLR